MRKLILFLLFISFKLYAQSANPYILGSGSLVIKDDFNRTNSTTLGANWTNQRGSPDIVSNQVEITANDDEIAFWNANTFADNQYSQVEVIVVNEGNDYVGATVRAADTGATMDNYVCSTDGTSGSGGTEIGEWTNNSYSALAASTTTFGANDIIRCEVSGTTISLFNNGTFINSTTDVTLTAGSPGVAGFNGGGANATLDNWEGGNL